MILKLSGADFSANNIGQVEVQNDLLQYTEQAITASGNNSLTPIQKSALDNLFKAMGADGSNNVMSKMRKVYLPIIAGDVSKAVVNYATNSFTNDKELNSAKWTLRNHGLVGIASGQNINLTETNPLVVNNYSCFLLRTELVESGVDDGSYVAILRGVTNTNRWLGLRQASLSNNLILGLGEYGAIWGGNKSKGDDLIKTTCVNSSSTFYDLNIQGDWSGSSSSPITATSDMSQETSQTLYVCGLSSVQTTKAYGVIMYGEALTTEQAKDICNKIDALYATFVV